MFFFFGFWWWWLRLKGRTLSWEHRDGLGITHINKVWIIARPFSFKRFEWCTLYWCVKQDVRMKPKTRADRRLLSLCLCSFSVLTVQGWCECFPPELSHLSNNCMIVIILVHWRWQGAASIALWLHEKNERITSFLPLRWGALCFDGHNVSGCQR